MEYVGGVGKGTINRIESPCEGENCSGLKEGFLERDCGEGDLQLSGPSAAPATCRPKQLEPLERAPRQGMCQPRTPASTLIFLILFRYPDSHCGYGEGHAQVHRSIRPMPRDCKNRRGS